MEQDLIKALKMKAAEEAFLERKALEEEDASRKLPPPLLLARKALEEEDASRKLLLPLSEEGASSFQKGECLKGVN